MDTVTKAKETPEVESAQETPDQRRTAKVPDPTLRRRWQDSGADPEPRQAQF